MSSWLSSSLARAVVFGAVCALAGNEESGAVSHITFGSCSKHEHRQPLWGPLAASKPDVFVWLGDAIYGDRQVFPGYRLPEPTSVMEAKYKQQKAHLDYQLLLNSATRVLGTWDDHDFGVNNGGQNYQDKDKSKQLFLDFIDEPPSSARRTRAGMYDSWTYGPKGKRVTIILLDVRYFKTDSELLGEQQWAWLEQTLKQRADSNLFLIGSGIQVLQSDRPLGEKWSAYAADKQRLLDTIAKADLPGVAVLLSGDVHFAELSCAEAGMNHPLLELTSSGLTHAWGEVGEFAFVPRAISYIARAMLFAMPARYQLNNIEYQRNISSVYGANYFPYINYGGVKIDWEQRNVELMVHGEGGHVALNHTFSFNKTAFHGDEMITCRAASPWYDTVAPTMARVIVAVVLAVLTLDLWLLFYLVAMFIPQQSNFDKDKKA